ncbi:GSCOCG00012840001-RA-CDS [Cotesia congregata]|nr:GSCOCG00012840001-RA-CDS [Cotesia congregata]
MKISNTLSVFLITLFGAVIGNKIPVFKYINFTVELQPGNPYFENWSTEINEGGDTLSVRSPVKADPPEDLMARIIAEVNGDRVFFIEIGVCESYESGMADQNLLDHGYPKDKFPSGCPIKAGDYGVRDYKFTAENIPFEVPAGDFIVKYSFFEPNGEPLVTLTSEGQLTYK